jgi:hypothetical protein
MSVGPGKDLCQRENVEGHGIALAAPLGKKLGDRGATRQTASTNKERLVNRQPRFARSVDDGTRAGIRPFTRASALSPGPGHDLAQRQPRKAGWMGNAALFRQQLAERRSTRQSAASLPHGRIDGGPRLAWHPVNGARLSFRPSSMRRPISIGPLQNAFDRKSGQCFGAALAAMLGQKS